MQYSKSQYATHTSCQSFHLSRSMSALLKLTALLLDDEIRTITLVTGHCRGLGAHTARCVKIGFLLHAFASFVLTWFANNIDLPLHCGT